jgi:hypothetical protein
MSVATKEYGSADFAQGYKDGHWQPTRFATEIVSPSATIVLVAPE